MLVTYNLIPFPFLFRIKCREFASLLVVAAEFNALKCYLNNCTSKRLSLFLNVLYANYK